MSFRLWTLVCFPLTRDQTATVTSTAVANSYTFLHRCGPDRSVPQTLAPCGRATAGPKALGPGGGAPAPQRPLCATGTWNRPDARSVFNGGLGSNQALGIKPVFPCPCYPSKFAPRRRTLVVAFMAFLMCSISLICKHSIREIRFGPNLAVHFTKLPPSLKISD